MQCSKTLIKEQFYYDVPATSVSSVPSSFTVQPAGSSSSLGGQECSKKKTCNLENYFEWSNRLRLFVANEILQVYIYILRPHSLMNHTIIFTHRFSNFLPYTSMHKKKCSNESDRTNKIELWSNVAQHCLLVGNYNSATSILGPIIRFANWQMTVCIKFTILPLALFNHSYYRSKIYLFF